MKRLLAAFAFAACALAHGASIGVYGSDPIEIPSASDLAAADAKATQALSNSAIVGTSLTNYADTVVVQVAQSNPNAATFEAFRMVLADLYYKYESLKRISAWDNIQDAVDSAVQSAMTNYVSSSSLSSALASYVPVTRTINGMSLAANRTLSASNVGAIPLVGSTYSMGSVSGDAYPGDSFGSGISAVSYTMGSDTTFYCYGNEARPCYFSVTATSSCTAYISSYYYDGYSQYPSGGSVSLSSGDTAVFQVLTLDYNTYVTRIY